MACASIFDLKFHRVHDCSSLIGDPCVVGQGCCSFVTLKRHVISWASGPFQCNNSARSSSLHAQVHAFMLFLFSKGLVLGPTGTVRVNGTFSSTGSFSGQRQESHNFQQNLPTMALIVPLTQLVWRLANIDSLKKGFVLAVGVSYEYRTKPAVLKQRSR